MILLVCDHKKREIESLKQLKAALKIKNIKADIHLIAIDSDIFFTPDEDQKTFELVKENKENIFYHEIKSIHGHDAFLIENEIVSKILSMVFKPKLKP